MNSGKLVVGLTGMPGSGKSLVVQTAKELGYEVVTMGDVIREETAKRGLTLNPANVGKVMLELRAEGGDAVIAEKCVQKIQGKAAQKIIIDGIRSLIEAVTFKAHFEGFVLVTVYAPPKTRFTRLSGRGRSDDPPSWEVFHERDMRELGVGLGKAVAMAEQVIINDQTKDALKEKVVEVLGGIETKWLQ
ncbi:MAG: AAA family ATPase [Candidatus Bathyarchaeota archaeon]|nr:AAA family ATPase [Candidatus Bathyarchaeota archaeon]